MSGKLVSLLILFCVVTSTACSQPVFVPGHDPKPPGTAWKKVGCMSDEFEGASLDSTKWQSEPVGNGWGWYGRPPGLFRASNVAVKDGKMGVTVSRLDEPVVRDGKTFTHQGAIVRSLKPGHVGWYFECKMKANATVMSSTFWLMTKGDSRKKLELDIQECVGRTTDKAESWAKHWNQIFHSNAIHRTNRYNKQKVQIQRQVKTETRNSQRYYVYGAWWKSPAEIRFYLDGKYCYSIRPEVEWDVPAYIQMAIETYSWNPIPDGGGLVENGTWEERTTRYEWVRTWKLEPETTTSPIAPAVPEVAGDYVLIYKPQPDVYTGNDTEHYRAGQTYTSWQPNDHTFIKGPDRRWHCFGITRPDDVKDDGVHEGEGLCFHAVAPPGELEQALRPESWMDRPKLNISGCGWAPHAMKIGNTYSLISSTKGRADSMDLYTWKDKGKLSIKSGNRDPGIMYWDGTYYLVMCNDRSVTLVTSRNFVNWSDPVDIFTAPEADWNCESPTLMRYNDTFYLFWCLWDSGGSGAKLPALYDGHDPSIYDYRTYVYASDTPTDFNNRSPVTELKAHAPEIIRGEKGDYFISSADYPQRGINLARLVWKAGK